MEFLCYTKCILTETPESLGRQAWTTLVLYITTLCALCTAGSFDKAHARLLLIREVSDSRSPQRRRATSIRRSLISHPCDSLQDAIKSQSRRISSYFCGTVDTRKQLPVASSLLYSLRKGINVHSRIIYTYGQCRTLKERDCVSNLCNIYVRDE